MKKAEQLLEKLSSIEESDYSNDTMESYVGECQMWHDTGKKILGKLKECVYQHANKPDMMETYKSMKDCHTTMGENLKTMKRKMK